MPGQAQLDCPECGATLRLKVSAAEVAGKTVRCPQCQAKFAAPAAKASSASRPQRAAEPDDDDLPAAPPARKRAPAPPPPPPPTRRKKSSAADAFDTRSRRGKVEQRPAGTAFLVWTGLGIVGALLGLALWVGVTYATHRGLGFLAIIVGCLVGVGVRLGAREHEGWMPGLTALFLALSTIFVGNVAVTYLLFDDSWGGGILGGLELSSEEEIIAEIAENEVIPEFQKAGKPFELSDDEFDKLPDDYTTKDEYLPAVWTEAEQRWKTLTPDQQAAKKQELMDARMGLDRDSMIARIVEDSVAKEFAADGKPVHATEVTEDTGVASGYHPDAWAEGVKRWEALTPDEQAAAQDSARRQHEQAEQAVQMIFTPAMFLIQLLLNFGLMGFVYCIVAGVIAYRLGSTSAIV